MLIAAAALFVNQAMDLPAMDVGFHKGIDAYTQVRFAGNVPCKTKVGMSLLFCTPAPTALPRHRCSNEHPQLRPWARALSDLRQYRHAAAPFANPTNFEALSSSHQPCVRLID